MKTPIVYYGGKQSMLKHILPLIPNHKIYVEPFVGGGAVFWAKEPVSVEVINDTNSEVINFYQVLKNDFKHLNKEIQATLHSREQFRQAKVIYQNPDLFTSLKRAWAFWVLSCQSYSSSLGCGWRHVKGTKVVRDTNNRKGLIKEGLQTRLENAQVECADALKVIPSWDDAGAFFYIDPPYFNANMGHYGGYTQEDFMNLLEVLSQMKGRFLLSSYPSDVLNDYIKKYGWKSVEIHRNLGMRKEGQRSKVEVLTANYDMTNS
jgi:DNA adenine methylase